MSSDKVYHLGAALQGIADEHADVLSRRQISALYIAAAFVWDMTNIPASADRNPEGEKPEALSAQHESAVPKADAKPLSPKDIQG